MSDKQKPKFFNGLEVNIVKRPPVGVIGNLKNLLPRKRADSEYSDAEPVRMPSGRELREAAAESTKEGEEAYLAAKKASAVELARQVNEGKRRLEFGETIPFHKRDLKNKWVFVAGKRTRRRHRKGRGRTVRETYLRFRKTTANK